MYLCIVYRATCNYVWKLELCVTMYIELYELCLYRAMCNYWYIELYINMYTELYVILYIELYVTMFISSYVQPCVYRAVGNYVYRAVCTENTFLMSPTIDCQACAVQWRHISFIDVYHLLICIIYYHLLMYIIYWYMLGLAPCRDGVGCRVEDLGFMA